MEEREILKIVEIVIKSENDNNTEGTKIVKINISSGRINA